ncbi:GAF domain-containing sensor histidine kinase [Alicyclobacillus sp. SO9]|uniref:GAF domain-containing sensor histidine kinase n=1 Tax=Alicyclobacillus sp. SO9 TaxID=2665646 RepID=UPI0018E8C26A|nr:GAF domain-containing sensor histidine kinase [Alicyclobacillus sp. SO9]QQE77435.1 GAF domain-containing sensor histidine kinase [Alicyclobacillus sp. SO9]
MTDMQDFALDEPSTLRILKELAEVLNEANDVSAAMAAILPRLGQVLGLSTAWAFRYDPSRSSFVEVGASGLPPALAKEDTAALKSGWCECQSQFVDGTLRRAVNLVRCSRLRDATGDKQGLVYHASIPLQSNGKPLGILNVAASGPTVFTENALALLTTIGHQVAIAVDRAGILAEQRERSKKSQALSQITAELVSFVERDEILQFAADSLVKHLHYEAAGILNEERDPTAPEAGRCLIAAAHADAEGEPGEYSYARDTDPAAVLDEEPVILSNARSSLEINIPQSPFILRLESRKLHVFTDADKELLESFAWHMTAALENERLYHQSVKSVQWRERRRLAADLHDAVSQRLFSALLLTRSLSLANKGADTKAQGATLTRIQNLIAQSQQEMRELIQTLRPAGGEKFLEALKDRLSPFQAYEAVKFEITAPADIPDMDPQTQQALLKVVDEAVQNTLRHAQATTLSIRILNDTRELIIAIEDNGTGFDVTNTQAGLGTSTMKERVEQAGGTFTLHSKLHEGTRVVIRIPLATRWLSDKGDM